MVPPTGERAFDPCCEFLLTQTYDNLFEQVGESDIEFRCKGCGATVQRRDRQEHHAHHKASTTARRNENGGNGMAALEVNQKVVDRIVREITEGKGLTAVAAGLNKDGVKVPGRAKTWYAPTVRNIVLKETGASGLAELRKKSPLVSKAKAPAKAASKSTAKSGGKAEAKPDPKPGKASSRTTRGRRTTSRKRSR